MRSRRASPTSTTSLGFAASRSLEEASSEVSVGLHGPDEGFDSAAAPELRLDDAEHAAFSNFQVGVVAMSA